MSDNANSHELLAVVAAVHHERVGEALDDRALGLAEALSSIATGSVRKVNRGADLNVIPEIAHNLVSNCFLKILFLFPLFFFFFFFQLHAITSCKVSKIHKISSRENGNFFFLLREATSKYVRQGDVSDFNILVTPLVEQLHATLLSNNLLGQNLESRRRALDLNFPVVRHYYCVWCSCRRG